MLTRPYPSEEVDEPEHENIVPSPLLVREHLDIVLASDEFSSSRRASELLQHLVKRGLAGDPSSLKERLLGVEIFHRRSDYDTSTDAIVRVTANDVRRRLALFYTKHSDEPVRISLPLGSYVPDFITVVPRIPLSAVTPSSSVGVPYIDSGTDFRHELRSATEVGTTPSVAGTPHELPVEDLPRRNSRILPRMLYGLGLLVALLLGWWLRNVEHGHVAQSNTSYAFYSDLLGPIGLNGPEKTEIAITNPHVLLYHGLNSPGPALGVQSDDIPVSPDMAAVLNQSANDDQANFPFHHFFVDTNNYTGIGEAKTAFGLARMLQATGRNAELTEERFLNWAAIRQEQLVILGAPHESKFVQDTLSAANFTIGYDSIHNAHPLPNEKSEYSRSHDGKALEDYGLIWMTQSPSGTRLLVLAGLSSAGTAGVGEFFSDPRRMRPIYQQLQTAAGKNHFPDSWQVLLRVEAREDIPINVTPIAVRITQGP